MTIKYQELDPQDPMPQFHPSGGAEVLERQLRDWQVRENARSALLFRDTSTKLLIHDSKVLDLVERQGQLIERLITILQGHTTAIQILQNHTFPVDGDDE